MSLNEQNLNKNKGCSGCLIKSLFILFCLICIIVTFPFGPLIAVGIYLLVDYLKQKEIEKKIEQSLIKCRKNIDKKRLYLSQLRNKVSKNSQPNSIKHYKGCAFEIFELEKGQEAVKLKDWNNQLVERYYKEASDFDNPASINCLENVSSLIYTNKLRQNKTLQNLIDDFKEMQKYVKQLNNYVKKCHLDIFFFSKKDARERVDVMLDIFGSKEKYLQEQKERWAQEELNLQKEERVDYLAKAYKKRSSTTQFKKNLAKVDDLINLTPIEFEKWVKKNIFEKEGWQALETKKTGDGGIDLVLWKDKEKSIAQCKRFRGTVGQPMLRDFYGTMMSEGVSRGYFVTTGLFSLAALQFSEDKPIEMIDRRVLAQKLSIPKKNI
jgi:HJR/Mrr/RecB family endonuclease